jgi:hypothetical protein
MSLTGKFSRSMTCPKCKTPVNYGDIFIVDPPVGSKLAIGNATQVKLQPCGCTAVSGDPLFLEMVQIVEVIAHPETLDATAKPG